MSSVQTDLVHESGPEAVQTWGQWNAQVFDVTRSMSPPEVALYLTLAEAANRNRTGTGRWPEWVNVSSGALMERGLSSRMAVHRAMRRLLERRHGGRPLVVRREGGGRGRASSYMLVRVSGEDQRVAVLPVREGKVTPLRPSPPKPRPKRKPEPKRSQQNEEDQPHRAAIQEWEQAYEEFIGAPFVWAAASGKYMRGIKVIRRVYGDDLSRIRSLFRYVCSAEWAGASDWNRAHLDPQYVASHLNEIRAAYGVQRKRQRPAGIMTDAERREMERQRNETEDGGVADE